MKMVAMLLSTFLLFTTQFSSGLTFASTAPAVLWSPHQDGFSEALSYQTLSVKDLAKSVMHEGGWSNLLCSGGEAQQPLDFALVFIGRELHSSDISGLKYRDPALLDLLKASYTWSNFSWAYPYVATSEGGHSLENTLISEFRETCDHNFGVNVAFADSCSIEGENYQKLADLQSLHEHLVSIMEGGSEGKANLVFFCHGGPDLSGVPAESSFESRDLTRLIGSIDQSGAKYAVLYVSQPLSSIQHPSHRQLERFLAEVTYVNGSFNSARCDAVCQIKSSLLEGILVGIVLLIILISGLCCMMGIDTPTRFETPQDS